MEKMCNKKNFFIIFYILTVMLIVVRDIFSLNLPFIIFSVMCLLASVFCNQKDRLLYILSLLPFCKGIPYSEMLLIVLAVDFILTIKNKRRIIKLSNLFFLLGILIIELINYVHFNAFSIKIGYLLLYMFFVSYIIQTDLFKNYYKKLILYFCISTIIAVTSIAVREISMYGFNYIIAYNLRFGANIENIVGTSFNSNELGLYCIIATSLLLVLFKYEGNKFLLLLAVLCSALGLLSISRTYIILIILLWILFVFLFKIKITHFIYLIFSFFIVFTLTYYFYPHFVKWLFDFSKNRTSNTEFLDGDRIYLLKMYSDHIFKGFRSIVFGYSQNYMTVLNTEIAVHNAIQEILVCWGISGLIISISWIISIVKQVNYCKLSYSQLFTRIIPFVFFIAYVQTIQLFTMNSYLIIMMLSMIPFSLENNK